MNLSRPLLALSAVALVMWPLTAEATVVVSDDAMYSVDLSAATICFVEPSSLRNDADCAGIRPADVPSAAVTAPLARMAYGLVRGPGEGENRAILGVVSLLRAPSHATASPDEATAAHVGEEAAAALTATLPAGSRLVPRSSKIAWGRNVPVVRTALDTSAVEAGGAAAAHGHRELVTAIGGRYHYITMWSGAAEHAAELALFADAAASTTDLKPEARPIGKLNPWPGRVLFFFGVVGLMLLRFRKKRVAASKPPAA